ncbi:MAG: UDP-N-acetylmuramate--L-alanine ligase [Actinobacteria bacterium]|nr:UDP-N-acetylmuramate--L-alanine ligase [Actinomycetota bacterium]
MQGKPWSGRRLHFVGIGGAGMSGLALAARALGAEVTGSDRAESGYMGPLHAAGIEPAIGHDAGNVPAGAEVVVSTAIPDDNPEVRAAADRPLHRREVLAELSRLKRCIAIAGTHGKTTTACMTAHALLEAGRRPSYLIGGDLLTTGRNADWTDGEWLVVEADESDGTFLALEPEVAVVTNVELDHHSTYRSLLEVQRAFERFASGAATTIAWEGAALDGADSTYGIEAGDVAAADVVLGPDGSRCRVLGADLELRVPGRHNVLNAVGAVAACRHAGLPAPDAAAALRTFPGAGRRLEFRGRTASGAAVYDDYAHHPTEVRATLEAARLLGAGRVIACFQPHLYSRTRAMARDFGRSLAAADVTCVLEVYPARERAEDFPGVGGWLVAAAAADAAGGRPVFWTPAMEDAERLLAGLLEERDLAVTIGAGDVDRLAARLVEAG